MQDNLKMERTIDDLMDENKKFRSKPGPTVYIGGIIIPYHMKKMKLDALENNLDAPNTYYWPELWFPTLKNKIIKGPGNTE
jgi:hypothetical protein